MSIKTRNIPWAVPMLATLAVVAALIAFGALGANTASAGHDTTALHALDAADGCGIIYSADYDLTADGTVELECRTAGQSLEVQFVSTFQTGFLEGGVRGWVATTDYRDNGTVIRNEPVEAFAVVDEFDDADDVGTGIQISIQSDFDRLAVPDSSPNTDGGITNGEQITTVDKVQADGNGNVFLIVYSREATSDAAADFGDGAELLSGAVLAGTTTPLAPTAIIQVKFVDPSGAIIAVGSDTVCQGARGDPNLPVAINADIEMNPGENLDASATVEIITPRVVGVDDAGDDIIATAVFVGVTDVPDADNLVVSGAIVVTIGAGTPEVNTIAETTVNVQADAPTGSYTLTVREVGLSGLASGTVTIVVAGPTDDLEIQGSEWIALNSTEQYIVIRLDENGVITTCDTVAIGLEVLGSNFETGGVITDEDAFLTLVGDTFSITASYDATQGETSDIVVYLGEIEVDRMNVTFGTPPPPPFSAPSDVMATSNAAGMVTVSWTDGENAPGGHLVLLFTRDFTEVPGSEVPADGTNTQSFTNIAAGDYVAVVVSIKTRSEYLYDYYLVTVN